MNASIRFATISELGHRLRSGDFTSQELANFCLDQLATDGMKLNAVVSLTRELAVQEAQRADDELKAGIDRGPLHGIPYAIKDLFATKGIPTSWGVASLKDQLIDHDATLVIRLREAGAVLCAKLAMVEFAGGFGYRQANASLSGPGLNPWNIDCWSGGSSSGSAATVAAGLVPFSIGTETLGSILTPSCYCGVTGLRPTYGRVSRYGAMALSWSMDKIGPICQSAEDCGLVLNVIAGPDPLDSSSHDESWHFGGTEEKLSYRFAAIQFSDRDCQPEVQHNFERSLDVIRQFGTIDSIELPEFPYGVVASTIISSEMAAAFESFVESGENWKLTAPEDRWGAYSNLMIPAKDYINALRIRRKIQAGMEELFDRYDVILTPTLSTEAGPVNQPFANWCMGYVPTEMASAANLAGLPGITLPNGFGTHGRPTGLELTAGAFHEQAILETAIAYQGLTDWHRQHPDISWNDNSRLIR